MIIDKAEGKIKLTKQEIGAIVFFNFFNKSGIKWVLGMFVIILLANLARIYLVDILLIIAYVIAIGFCVWFILIYLRKQKAERRKMWDTLKEAGAILDVEDD